MIDIPIYIFINVEKRFFKYRNVLSGLAPRMNALIVPETPSPATGLPNRSSAPDGLLGRGWGLEGVSEIRRCSIPPNHGPDGSHRIKWDAKPKFNGSLDDRCVRKRRYVVDALQRAERASSACCAHPPPPHRKELRKGLAERSALPTKLGELVAAVADNLEAHLIALDLTDENSRTEHDAYVTLAREHRKASDQLSGDRATNGSVSRPTHGQARRPGDAEPEDRRSLRKLRGRGRQLKTVRS
jgi:hypothetical protein